MNFNKGAKTRGRGTSFKGALTYYLHDKDTLETAHRVGAIELGNLATDDPYDAWREMMATAEAAEELKRRAGIPPGNKTTEQPVYCFALEWHPDDRVTEAHMREEASNTLKLLRLIEHQWVIVPHRHTPHPHVHVTVNLVHPETGKTANLWNDDRKMDRYCHEYEVRMGVIRSPDRAAKYQAIDDGRKPQRKPRTPKHFNDPALKAALTTPANDDNVAQDRKEALQAGIADYQRRLKATQAANWKRRKQESEKLWRDYRTAREAIRARHKFQMDQIYKHRRNRNALPLSIQGFRDWKETREWKKLMERLKAEKRRFEYCERTLAGFVTNAIALIRPGMRHTGKGLLSTLFTLLASSRARREIMQTRQGLAKQALSDKQFGSRKHRADRIRVVMDAQFETLVRAYDVQKQDLDRRHAEEIAEQKQAWRDLSAERKRLWAEWEQEFGPRLRQRSGQGSGTGDDGRSRSPAPPLPKDTFNQAARSVPPPDRPMRQRPAPAHSPPLPEKPDPETPGRGWKKRRSAAERRADGSYKPRVRHGPSL